MAKRGRRDRYETAVKPYLDDIRKKVRQGVTEYEIAKSLGISPSSLNNYRNKHPEFMDALCKDKGADVLQSLINAGVQGAIGYYKDEVTITEKDGIQTKTIVRRWYPPNPSLNQFYAKCYGKNEGILADPLEYELKKHKQELDEAVLKNKNWDLSDPK